MRINRYIAWICSSIGVVAREPATCQLIGGLLNQPVNSFFCSHHHHHHHLHPELAPSCIFLPFLASFFSPPIQPWPSPGTFEVIAFLHLIHAGPIRWKLVQYSVIKSMNTPAHLSWAQNSQLRGSECIHLTLTGLSWFSLSYALSFSVSLSPYYLSGIYVLVVALETGHTNTVAVDRKCCGTTMASLRLCARSPLLPSSLSLCLPQPACMLLSLAELYTETTLLFLSRLSHFSHYY